VIFSKISGLVSREILQLPKKVTLDVSEKNHVIMQNF
jgi:hypothetical protein